MEIKSKSVNQVYQSGPGTHPGGRVLPGFHGEDVVDPPRAFFPVVLRRVSGSTRPRAALRGAWGSVFGFFVRSDLVLVVVKVSEPKLLCNPLGIAFFDVGLTKD